jgi:hypothetical protein
MVILCLASAACGTPPSHAIASPSGAAGVSLGSLGSAGCLPAAALHNSESGLDSKAGSFWALFFASVPPPAGHEIKVVWRMTGSGNFAFRVSDAAGKAIPLAWGPEGHGGSTWVHPGDEVGTGLNFPHPGCWDIHVARSDTSADLWLSVTA